MAEGAPLLREYVGKTCIEGSNPSDSASTRPSNLLSGVRGRSEPRTTRGFLLWAPDCDFPAARPLARIARHDDLLTVQLVVALAVVKLFPASVAHLEVHAGGSR